MARARETAVEAAFVLNHIWTKIISAIRVYVAHDDPLVAAANTIALVVASNQPFYPLYILWAVSDSIWPAFFTFLSTPFFLAVPAVARRSTLAGRALLPLAGIGNTILCAKLFGEASGVELFLLPCLMIAALLFRQSERFIMLIIVGLGILIFASLQGRYGEPIHLYTLEEYHRFLRMNAFSVATLVVFVGLMISNAIAQIESRIGQ